jgi:hypothetical protein
MISRRQFLGVAAVATVRLKADTTDARTTALQPDHGDGGRVRLAASAPTPVDGATARPGRSADREGRQPDQRGGKPRGSEFVFARLRYESGDWDYNPKVAANVLDSVMQYTSIPVYKEEVVVSASSDELLSFPFVFMTGHKLVRFSGAERDNLRRFADAGGLLFSDDCNHDVNGLYAKSFEQEMTLAFPDTPLVKLPATHALYRSFFTFKGGPPQTSHELNGWGDNLVHDYLKGVERRGRLAVLYSSKDYGCEWDYDWRNKRFLREDNTKFAINIVVYVMG